MVIPGQKVITRKGFVNIESIQEGNEVLSKEGKWHFCVPTKKEYRGRVCKINAYGQGDVEVTEDHQIWVLREGTWQWIAAKDVMEGDAVCQPWLNYNFSECKYVCYDERVTCSKEIKKVFLTTSSDLYELVGYFLGDGCIEYSNSDTSKGHGIGLTFEKTDTNNIERVRMLVKEIFGKDIAEYEHGENAVRLKFYSKGFSKWVKSTCYDSEKQKILPWSIESLVDSEIRPLLKGLIESDGSFEEDKLDFGNTSPNLAQFVYFAMLRLGMNPSFSWRGPRTGKPLKDGRIIVGKKEEYMLKTTGLEARNFVSWMRNPVRTAKKTFNFGMSVAKVGKIEAREYDGFVYDMTVDGNDQSFCVPGITVGRA